MGTETLVARASIGASASLAHCGQQSRWVAQHAYDVVAKQRQTKCEPQSENSSQPL